MLTIDGSKGEGGGQILRTSLALSLVTGTPFRLEKIRAKRRKPGLLRQHLTAVKAVEALGASVDGAELGAREIVVRPGAVRGGEHRFAVGSAGSACLVLQTVLPPLLAAGVPARLELEGGTHNPFAPTWDYLDRVFLPLLGRMGASVKTTIAARGFYPAGGGRFTVEIEPTAGLRPLEILERGEITARRARALVAHLPGSIGLRELAVVKQKLGWREEELALEQVADSPGPGNVLMLEVESAQLRELCTGFGEKGVKAETVARRAVSELRRHLESGAPVGEHLADQLVVPFSLAGGGTYRTLPLSEHTRTNLDVVRRFLPVRIDATETERDALLVFAEGA